MAVKFKMSHTIGSLYVEGDVAKFDAKVEKELIDRKIADRHAVETAAEKPAA